MIAPGRGKPDLAKVPPTAPPDTLLPAVPDHLWLAVSFPFLPLDALGQAKRKQPMAVYTQQGQVHKVVTPNPAATKSGIQAGMTLTAAQALNPALHAIPRDISAESDRLQRLALLAGNWTPAVSIVEDSLLLDIAGSTRLFGGIKQLLEQIRLWIASETLAPCVSVMPTPASAVLCARTGKALCITAREHIRSAIRELPARTLITDSKRQRALNRFGINTLGDLLRLPRDGLARRLGPDLVQRLDKLLGQQPDPQNAITPLPVFRQRIVFDAGIANTEQLAPFMKTLLGKLQAHLTRHHILAEQLEWHLVNESDLSHRIPVYLTQPHRDTVGLMKLSRLALEKFKTKDVITHLVLKASRFAPLPSSSEDIFSILPKAADRGRSLVERLQNRLGRCAVQGLRIQPDHRPEKAWDRCDAGETGALPYGAQRPLWLLETPRSVRVSQGQLVLGDQQLLLQRQRERICSGWWDSQPVRRDYYHARTAALQAWVFRDLDSGNWCLHGIF
ncbi:MAG: DNA polymerase Y family protein [Arenicellales bacterium]|nr:DNA polymerase Y family protein [Arenicellales bacterium]MDP6918782.1 DNA polymerase Y family protein [Arenicellales bacterium]